LMPWFGFVSEKPGKVESTTDSNPHPPSGPQKWDPWD